MVQQSIKRLEYLCEIIPELLSEFNESDFSKRPHPDKWSKKEILGHLIDSATNNHQRFVRVQFEKIPTIVYDQNKWNEYSYHSQLSSSKLILFWKIYNEHLASLMKQIPLENLKRLCNTGKENVTLEFLINDYVGHLEHHLRQIIKYD
jgi:hypothetical protein